MDTVMLKVFVQVAKRGSFSEAATAMGISKSQCSKLISKLEKDLRTSLLERTTRRVRLTLSGARYLSDILPLLEEFEAANERVSQTGSSIREIIRIGAPSCILALFLWPIVEQLMRLDPSLGFRLITINPRELENRPIDCAFVFNDVQIPSAIVLHDRQVPLLFVASPDYLFRHDAPSHGDELRAHRCFLQANLLNSSHGAEGLERIEAVLVAGDGRLVRDAALAGKGIALLPDYLVKSDLASGRLVRILSECEASPARLKVLSFPENIRRPVVRSFLDHVDGLEIWKECVIGSSGPLAGT